MIFEITSEISAIVERKKEKENKIFIFEASAKAKKWIRL
jgi:hypothetical protein